MSEIGEGQPKNIEKVDLTKKESFFLGPEISIPGEQLGADKWSELLDRTNQTGKEYGFCVWERGKKISIDKITEGLEGEWYPDLNILARLFKTNISIVHSHPKPAALDHVETTLVSMGDINSFINSSSKSLVMLDKGGVHLLIRQGLIFRDESTDVREEFKDVFRGFSNKTSADVRKETAKILSRWGIKYFFSNTLTPSADGFVNLKDVLYTPPAPQTTTK